MSSWKHAFSLSAEEVKRSEPPGTVRLVNHEARNAIQLMPKSTKSSLDPLNWPTWRKYTVLVIMSLHAAVANFGANSVAPALVALQYQLRPAPSYSDLSHLVAYHVLLIGVSNIVWVPLSNTFGRRPVLIVSLLLALLSSVWCGLASSYNSLLAARIVQGAGFGPADSVAPEVVGEIFFVHLRGRGMAVYTLFLAGGAFVGGIAGGYIASDLGYKYIFWITTALLGFVLLLELAFVPETRFERTAHPLVGDDDIHVPRKIQPREQALSASSTSKDRDGGVQHLEDREHISIGDSGSNHAVSAPPSLTFVQSLKFGVYRGNLFKNFLTPWLTLALPGTVVVSLLYGGLLGGTVAILTVTPAILAAPPYFWGANVGLINVGGLIGTLLGFIASFFSADLLLKMRAKRDSHGLGEPESRLPGLFPALFLATTGIWTVGFCADHASSTAWVGMEVGTGMVSFGLMQVPSIGFNYLVDAYTMVSADCFVMTTISRAVVSFAWSFFVAQWVEDAGAALPFGIFGRLMGLFSLLAVALWIFGKRMRIATASYLPRAGG